MSSDPQSPPPPTEGNISHNGGSSHCNRCRRPLKNPIYRRIGMGKICLGKSNLPNKLELLQQILTEEQKLREEKKHQKLLETQKTLDIANKTS